MAEAVGTSGASGGRQSLQAAIESLGGIARSEIAAALLDAGPAEATSAEPRSLPPQLASALRLEGVLPADDVRHASELMTLPAGFGTQAAAMPLYLRKLLVENAAPASACIGSVLRALRLPPAELGVVCASLARPRRELLMRRHGFLTPTACAALRAAVDGLADAGKPTDALVSTGDPTDAVSRLLVDLSMGDTDAVTQAKSAGGDDGGSATAVALAVPSAGAAGEREQGVERLSHVAAPKAAARSTKEDSVDGLPEHQLNLTLESLLALVGSETVEALRALPNDFSQSSAGASSTGDSSSVSHDGAGGDGGGAVPADERRAFLSALVIQRAFVRRYIATERPWFSLHMDTAALTANVALASDALHEGGKLCVACSRFLALALDLACCCCFRCLSCQLNPRY